MLCRLYYWLQSHADPVDCDKQCLSTNWTKLPTLRPASRLTDLSDSSRLAWQVESIDWGR